MTLMLADECVHYWLTTVIQKPATTLYTCNLASSQSWSNIIFDTCRCIQLGMASKDDSQA